jgi:hypothetical protein
VNHVYSYLTGQLARQQHRERLAEQRQARTAALAAAARRSQPASERRVRWAARKIWWLRSEPDQ